MRSQPICSLALVATATRRSKASCQQQVDAAQALTVTIETGARELKRIEQQWTQAKSACASRWTVEQAFTAFHTQMDVTAQQRATKSCDEAGQQATGALDASEAEGGESRWSPDDLASAVREQCKDVSNGPAVVAAVDQRVRKLQASREREKKREAALDVLNQRLRQNDAVGLLATISKDPDAKAMLLGSANSADLVIGLAKHWISNLAGAGAQNQLCASHGLSASCREIWEWTKLRAEAVANAGPVNGTKISNVMKACK